MSEANSKFSPTGQTKPRNAAASPQQQDGVQGEGEHAAARRYQAEVRRFVTGGKVDAAAARARPASRQEARELQAAEAAGREHSMGEDDTDVFLREEVEKDQPAGARNDD